jgi:hypothetical protein
MKRRNRQNQYRSSISTSNQKGTGKGEGIFLKIILWFIDIFSPEERCWWSSPALLCGPRTAPLKHEETLERKVICRLYKMTPENKSGGLRGTVWPMATRELSFSLYFLSISEEDMYMYMYTLLRIRSFNILCGALIGLVLETLTEIVAQDFSNFWHWSR